MLLFLNSYLSKVINFLFKFSNISCFIYCYQLFYSISKDLEVCFDTEHYKKLCQ